MLTNKVSFEFYFNVFCNGKTGVIPAESFDRCLMLAERELDKYVSVRDRICEYDESICMCLCEMAEFVFQKEKSGDIVRETIDGYTVAFGADKHSSVRVKEIIFRWLGKTGLLYAGVE